MPTVFASVAASLVGWLVDAPVRAAFGPVVSTAVSLVVGAAAFFIAKRILTDLRGG